MKTLLLLVTLLPAICYGQNTFYLTNGFVNENPVAKTKTIHYDTGYNAIDYTTKSGYYAGLGVNIRTGENVLNSLIQIEAGMSINEFNYKFFYHVDSTVSQYAYFGSWNMKYGHLKVAYALRPKIAKDLYLEGYYGIGVGVALTNKVAKGLLLYPTQNLEIGIKYKDLSVKFRYVIGMSNMVQTKQIWPAEENYTGKFNLHSRLALIQLSYDLFKF